MGNKMRVTQKQIDEMKEYRNAGFSMNEIADSLGVSVQTVQRYAGGSAILTPQLIDKMQEMVRLGLSHSQIAKELDISYYHVQKALGKQKFNNRASYGSLASYAKGSSFIPKELQQTTAPIINEETPFVPSPVKEETRHKMKIIKSSVTMEGEKYSYKLSSDGGVRLTSATGFAVDMTDKEFANFMNELKEVSDWRAKNLVKENELPPFRPCSARVAG